MTKRRSTVPPSRAKRSPQVMKRAEDRAETAKVAGHDPRDRNLKEQGHQGNIAQNTRNQGYQQDR